MYKIFLRTTFLLAALAVMTVGCSKQANNVEHDEDADRDLFCSLLNVENIGKTMPIVNQFLSGMTTEMDNERQLKELAAWLKSCPCVVDVAVGAQLRQMSEIVVSFDENETIKQFIMEVSMKKPLKIIEVREYERIEEDPIPEKNPIPTDEGDISFTEFSLDGTSCQWNITSIITNNGLKDGVIIINSMQELEKFIVCLDGNYPEINFSKHSLLLAFGVSWNVITEISKTFHQQSTNYVLNVEMTVLKNANYRQKWSIALVTNKLSDESNVELNVIPFYDEEEPKYLEIETGKYIETNPVKGNHTLNFIDGERLFSAKSLVLSGSNDIKYDEFKYEIDGYTIKLTPVEYPELPTYHYFRIVDKRKFEIGNIYITNHGGSTIPPIVYFEKQ